MMTPPIDRQQAKPVLKWAGGKSRLLPEIMRRLPAAFGAYHEPFIGAGALFFELAARGKLSHAFISDVNPSLIDVYLGLRDAVEEVIQILQTHPYDSDHFYYVRSLDPQTMTLPERAARIIYLNKTCYNGLYRENRAGQFNVPFGRYSNPQICNQPNLLAVSGVLQSVDISVRPFSSVLAHARPGDFVYFDPPYHPLSTTSNFTAYARDGFGQAEQVRLRDVFAELTRNNVYALLSNSDTPYIRELYADYEIDQVFATRSVNSKAAGRGKVPEVLVRNYPLVPSPTQ